MVRAFAPIVLSGSGERNVRLWDVDTESCISALDGHDHTVSGLATHTNPENDESLEIFTSSWDGFLRVYKFDVSNIAQIKPSATGRDHRKIDDSKEAKPSSIWDEDDLLE
mmetsp:Transcript_19643/g.50322  ORF Transcript_19643/g.50322 Transcript_19643/m.50322 type:complete len:110 (+) Transcript_19643:297-626(+)